MSLSISAASRRTVAVAALSMIAAGGVTLATQASAEPCALDAYNGLSAAVVATQSQAVHSVDATGCDIGVYVAPGITGVSVTGTISGRPDYYGVLVNGGGADVTGAQVDNVGDTPQDGAQHGVAVAYINGATGTVSGTEVSNYQKDGILASGDNTNVTITGNQVTGSGPDSTIGQNGIQVSSNATATVVSNEIDDNYYTGCSSQEAAHTGCISYVATGLLLYGVDASSVKASNNKFRGDQRNQALITSSSLS